MPTFIMRYTWYITVESPWLCECMLWRIKATSKHRLVTWRTLCHINFLRQVFYLKTKGWHINPCLLSQRDIVLSVINCLSIYLSIHPSYFVHMISFTVMILDSRCYMSIHMRGRSIPLLGINDHDLYFQGFTGPSFTKFMYCQNIISKIENLENVIHNHTI